MAPLGYVSGVKLWYHCLIDVDLVSLTSPSESSVAKPLELLFKRESALFAGPNFIKPKNQCPSPFVLQKKRVYSGVKPNHYLHLFKRLLAARMVTLLESGTEVTITVIENSIFVVWKMPNVSQRLIWTGGNPISSLMSL